MTAIVELSYLSIFRATTDFALISAVFSLLLNPSSNVWFTKRLKFVAMANERYRLVGWLVSRLF